MRASNSLLASARGASAEHPAFGPLTPEEWAKLSWKP